MPPLLPIESLAHGSMLSLCFSARHGPMRRLHCSGAITESQGFYVVAVRVADLRRLLGVYLISCRSEMKRGQLRSFAGLLFVLPV